MSWRILDNEAKVEKVFDHLLTHEKEILVKVKGEKDPFTSRLVKVDKGGARKSPELVIEGLTPNEGNSLIQVSPEIVIEFLLNKNSCRFPVEYVGINNTPPHIGIVLTYPGSIEIEEKRRTDRHSYETQDFVGAKFTLGGRSGMDEVYEVSVLNCSKYGLGMIITEKDRDVIAILKEGDELKDIRFFTPRAMVKVNGVVRHVTRIEEGEYEGCYVVGIQSPDIIDRRRPESL